MKNTTTAAERSAAMSTAETMAEKAATVWKLIHELGKLDLSEFSDGAVINRNFAKSDLVKLAIAMEGDANFKSLMEG